MTIANTQFDWLVKMKQTKHSILTVPNDEGSYTSTDFPTLTISGSLQTDTK